MARVVMLNPATCGIYKKGGDRFKIDPSTGERTQEIDNELLDHVEMYLRGEMPPGSASVHPTDLAKSRVWVPRYFDRHWLDDFLADFPDASQRITLGELVRSQAIQMLEGHGSPSNDRRTGSIPYIKVSDVRALRVNVNPTNLVTRAVAESIWGGRDSGLKAWDLLSPNRASANIGEFAVLLPGEEQRVLTKEFFRIRVAAENDLGIDWAYLLWAFSLKSVRRQWNRVCLMQVNREDVGERWREIMVPLPSSPEQARADSQAFRDYFTTIATAREAFVAATWDAVVVRGGRRESRYIATVRVDDLSTISEGEEEGQEVVEGGEG